jgi:hypothetical protein
MNTTISRRTFLQGVAAAGVAVPMVSRAANQASASLDVGTEPQLFLDDWIIDRTINLTRTLHQPRKHGLIKNTDGSDWDRGDVYMGNIVCRDAAGRFHMTYRYMWDDPGVAKLHPNIGNDKAHWYRESIAYATSTDGVHWTKPDLGLVEGPSGFQKQSEYPFTTPTGTSKHNNLGCPFDFIYDLHTHGNRHEPGKRFLLRLASREDTHPFAKVIESQLCFAPDWPDFANDPQWQKKLIPLQGADISPRGFRTMAGYDHAAREWFAVSQDTLGNWMPRGGRDVARFSSPDLAKWVGPQLVLPVASDEHKRPDDHVEYMDLMSYRIGGEESGVWLGQLLIFHGDRSDPQFQMPGQPNVWRKGYTELRLVTSRDAGKTWQRVCDKQVWLPNHPELHGYDHLVFSSAPIPVGDEMWMYYSAWDGEHLIFKRDGSLYEPGFVRTGRTARATFRKDGYVSLDAGKEAGEFVTKLLQSNGTELRLNVAAKSGAIRAEMQNASGKPLPGFTLADCKPIEGDQVSVPVRWNGGAVRAKDPKGVRIRFVLENASLYAFSFATA